MTPPTARTCTVARPCSTASRAAGRRAPPPRNTAAAAMDTHAFRLPDLPIPIWGLVSSMRELFGPKLPADIEYSPARPTDPALRDMAFTCTYDEGFCGHFSIPGNSGAAVRFDDVLSQEEPIAFIREHLEFRPLAYKNPKGEAADEVVIFAPGLNTLHMVKPGWMDETTTPQRLLHYVGLLQRPMAQMHLGTDMDQGEAAIPISPAVSLFVNVNGSALESAGIKPRIEDGHAYFAPRQRDRMESALTRVGFARPLLQAHIVQLLSRNEKEREPLVLMPYSRSTAEISGALQTYIDGYVKEHGGWMGAAEAREDVEAILRETLTVFTIGNVNRKWPDGPAYVHMSGVSGREEGGTDTLVQAQGVHAGAPEGAGADAVFLHPDGLFSGPDAHNFGASGASNLRIIMNMNDCVTFREVWEKAQEGPLKLPSYQETAAGVELCNGKHWLWEWDNAWNGVQLMHPNKAREILGDNW
eukprot:jgi/Ulvmu1/1849/UM012_0005.1